MPDPTTTDHPEGLARRGVHAALTSETIEPLLADFRTWLENLAGDPSVLVSRNSSDNASLTVDLFTLVGQFTALRHEVNLQTKASRSAIEQNAETLKQLVPAEPADDSERIRPIVKAVVDVADALALSLKQMEKLRESIEGIVDGLIGEGLDVEEPEERPAQPGFFARLFRAKPKPEPVREKPDWERLQPLAAAAADGYAMSLRRVERLFPTLELEPLLFIGEAFDPEWMEVVEVVGETGEPAGIVFEDVRPGYRWRGKLLRFAQVKVTR